MFFNQTPTPEVPSSMRTEAVSHAIDIKYDVHRLQKIDITSYRSNRGTEAVFPEDAQSVDYIHVVSLHFSFKCLLGHFPTSLDCRDMLYTQAALRFIAGW